MTPYPQDYLPVTEFIAYGWRKGRQRYKSGEGDEQTTLWRFKTLRADQMQHTTQKPVALAANAIANSSRPGALVGDLFGGSGTTLLAAEQLGRQARLLEIDPRYCDVIVQRWEEHTGQEAERHAA